MESSQDARLKADDADMVNGYDMGARHAEVARIPADRILPLSEGMTLLKGATGGVAGIASRRSIPQTLLNRRSD